MGSRRKGRELAIQALYQGEITGDRTAPGFDAFLKHFDGGDDSRDFALTLATGVLERCEAIDKLIENAAQHWRMDRLSKVDLCILRMATYELMACPEVPVNIVIDEAIEIAKRFGTRESASFVNGVLDAIAGQIGAKNRDSGPKENGRTVPTRDS